MRTEENKEQFTSMMNVIAALKDEVSKVYGFWENRTDKNNETDQKIKKIFLSGKDASLPGFDEYLTTVMKKKVEVSNVWTNAFSFENYIPKLSSRESLNYSVAVGLALPESY